MIRFFMIAASVFGISCTSATADYQKVKSQKEFINLVGGKTLTRPLVTLQVKSDGRIQGKGARWDVTGRWTWKDGFFCRSLAWGGDDLGYNCQEVRVENGRVRFTSDQGQGDSAEFRLK